VIKFAIYISAFLVTLSGVEFFRRWSNRRKILDIPNERSSHTTPTPRGGGLVLVLVSLISFTLFELLYSPKFVYGYLLGAGLIALISWLDDVYSLSAAWRIVCHFLAAGIAVWQFGYWSGIYLPLAGDFSLGVFGVVITILWIVWLTNAYNFMDGIDGIAGIQAIATAIGWCLIGWYWGVEIYSFYGTILFVTTLAFLIHNWHPAKIFMGDVGSAFLGYSFAVFPLFGLQGLNSERVSILPFIAIVFVWMFVFDSVSTLFRRLFNAEKVWQPHRKHFYQLLVIKGYSHQTVALFYGVSALAIVLAGVFRFAFNGSEIILISLIVMVTLLLLWLVYRKNLLTKMS